MLQINTLLLVFFITSTSYTQYIPFNNRIVHGKKGAVVCSSPEAAEVGIAILQQGGNAFDASVAVAFAMAVTYPQAGNIGGGGFLVGFAENKPFTLDYREKAPKRAHRDMFLDDNKNPIKDMSTHTRAASGVPGTVKGFWELHKKYGSLSWEKLVQPSIHLAKNGFPISEFLAYSLNSNTKKLSKNAEAKRLFTKVSSFKRGDILVQKELSETLERIAQMGADGFYKGKTARLLLNELSKGNGYITQHDLDEYTVKFRKPISFSYKGHTVISMPPPSSGGIALYGILKSLEQFDETDFPYGSAKYTQLFTEICRSVYADRSEFLGDPDIESVPLNAFLSNAYIQSILKSVRFEDEHAHSKDVSPNVGYFNESEETTHFSILDKYGNAVSNTYTLNQSYGSGIVVKGAGFLLNNQMDDFSIKPGVPNTYGLIGNEKNSIKPEKRMLSSMSPTIVLKDGKPYFIVGSPGGSTIITAVAQAIHRLIAYKMDVDLAINLPRIHHQWLPDTLYYEFGAISHDTQQILQSYQYPMKQRNVIGDCHGIVVTPSGIRVGVSSRGNGAAKTY